MLQYLNISDFLESLKDQDGEINHMGKEDYYNSIVALINLLKAQNSFQVKALGQENWWEVKELNGKPIDYGIAMLGEIGEAVDSLEFEWWANGKKTEDIQNLIVELIDALHFELSDCMSFFNKLIDRKDFNPEEKSKFITLALKHFGSNISNTIGCDRPICSEKNIFSRKEIFQMIKYYTFSSLGKRFDETYLSIGSSPGNEIYAQIISKIFDPIRVLFKILNCFGVSFNEAVARYNIKNALNFVRKANGYKEGKYEKKWISLSGPIAEDNVIALEIVLEKQKKDNTILNIEEIKILLDDYYKKVILPSRINN